MAREYGLWHHDRKPYIDHLQLMASALRQLIILLFEYR